MKIYALFFEDINSTYNYLYRSESFTDAKIKAEQFSRLTNCRFNYHCKVHPDEVKSLESRGFVWMNYFGAINAKHKSIAPDALSIEELEATAELAINQFAKRSHKELKAWIDLCEKDCPDLKELLIWIKAIDQEIRLRNIDTLEKCEKRIKALERLQETEGDSRPISKWMLINEKTGEVKVRMENVKYSAPFPDRLIC